MNKYPVQEMVRVVVEFLAPLQGMEHVDPTTVSLKLTPPNASSTDVVDGIVHDSTGVYHYDFVPGVMGQWMYRWQGLGVVIASSGNRFFLAI